jgi:uncharacterized phage protein gp47/JayE
MQTPTTRQLSDQIVSEIAASLSQTIPLLPKSFARVIAWVLAGAIVLVYKYAGFIFLQLFVAHASAQETTVNGKKIVPLVEWGILLGVGRPLAAQRAELIVSVPVTNQTGTIQAGQTLLRSETRVLYQVVAEVALDAPTIQLRIKAIGDDQGGDGSGAIGNLVAGDELTFATQPANVGSIATVVSQAVTGVDAEAIEVYRSRVVRRRQRPPQGGAYADYQAWGESVPGIVHVYPYAGVIPGTVEVYAEASEESSGSPDGFPTSPQLDAIRDAINVNEAGVATRRPVNAAPLVLSITRVPFSLEVSDLSPDKPESRTAIKDGVDEYLRSREPFIVGLSVLPRDDRVTEAAVSGVVDTIVSALGATVTRVELTPGPAYTLGHGEKAKLNGDPTYV